MGISSAAGRGMAIVKIPHTWIPETKKSAATSCAFLYGCIPTLFTFTTFANEESNLLFVPPHFYQQGVAHQRIMAFCQRTRPTLCDGSLILPGVTLRPLILNSVLPGNNNLALSQDPIHLWYKPRSAKLATAVSHLISPFCQLLHICNCSPDRSNPNYSGLPDS